MGRPENPRRGETTRDGRDGPLDVDSTSASPAYASVEKFESQGARRAVSVFHASILKVSSLHQGGRDTEGHMHMYPSDPVDTLESIYIQRMYVLTVCIQSLTALSTRDILKRRSG